MSSLSSWSLSDLFILLLLAILPTEQKRKGQGGHLSLPLAAEAKHVPRLSPTKAPGGGGLRLGTWHEREEPRSFGSSPAVGDAAAVPAHPQALLQMGSEAGGSDTATAVGADTLLALPLVENLSKDVQPRLVHDLWGQERRGDQGRRGTSCFLPMAPWPFETTPTPSTTEACSSSRGYIWSSCQRRDFQGSPGGRGWTALLQP